MSTYEIEKTLVLSTAHVCEATMNGLTDGTIQGYPYEEGVRIRVSDNRTGDPGELRHLLKVASKLRCEWLRLDADGPIHDNLPTWDW